MNESGPCDWRHYAALGLAVLGVLATPFILAAWLVVYVFTGGRRS